MSEQAGNIVMVLIQVPLVAAFIWFTLKLTQTYQERMAKRDAMWLEFLEAEREERRIVMGEFKKSLDQLIVAIMSLNGPKRAKSERRKSHG
jgi:Na+/phosphate symporter